MKQMKERYIYDVVRRLPESQRDEVSKELDANISDMMTSDSEEELIRVIGVLGEPRVLANEYREHQRYLISPKWMDDYLRVLKIVMTVLVSLSLVFGLMDNLLNPVATSAIGIIASVFSNTIGDMFDAALSAFAFVTLAFIIVEKYDVNPKKKPWSVTSLPELPKKDVLKVSKTGSFIGLTFTLIFGIAFGYILYYNQDYLRLFYVDGNIHVSEALFLNDAIMSYFPLFIVSMILSVAVLLLKIAKGYLGLNVIVLHTVQKAFSLFAFLYFIHLSPLFNPEFINQVGIAIELSSDKILEAMDRVFEVLTVVVSIAVGVDIIVTWIKYLRHQKELKKVA